MQQIQRYFRRAGKAILRFFGRVAHGSVLDIAILACGVGVVGVGTTIAVISAQGPQVPVDVPPAVSMSVSSSVSIPPVEQEVYDPNENALDSVEYDGTLLAETADGGEAYLEETIFIGDSNTYRLATYSLTSWQNNLSAVGMGIQHVTSTPSMYFKGMSDPIYMARAVAMMQPRRIVITYGTNNTDSSVETFKNQYRTALEAIKKEWPYADIIINAIPPVAIFRSNAVNTQKNIDAFNKALADLAKEDNYQFLNSSEVLKDPTTGFARTDYMIGDGLHLNEDGAKALMSYVRMHTHIVPDTRPALTELPIHQPTPEELFNPQAAVSSSSSSSDSMDGITVTFSIRGDKNGGTLSGTLMQLASPGKTCQPVTAMANAGYTMEWGCSEGRLYPGDGLSDVVNGAQSATFTVPNGTTAKELSVWVTFTKHAHTYASDDWVDQQNGTHAHWCTDPDCPMEDKGGVAEAHTWGVTDNTGMHKCTACGREEKDSNWTCTTHKWDNTHKCTICGTQGTHTWGATDSSTGMRKCSECGTTEKDPNWKAPHTHTWGKTDENTGMRTCSGCGATEKDPNWKAPHTHTWGKTDENTGMHTCSGCGATEKDTSWTAPHTTHTLGSYDQSEAGHQSVCSECNKPYGEIVSHNYTYIPNNDSSTHTMACGTCGYSTTGSCTPDGVCDCGRQLSNNEDKEIQS